MEDKQRSVHELEAPRWDRPTGENVNQRSYTERDIERLEAEDVAEPLIRVALLNAYEQNDPVERPVGLRANPGMWAYGTKSELEERLNEVEEELKHDPKHYYLREKRFYVLMGLAWEKKSAQRAGKKDAALQ